MPVLEAELSDFLGISYFASIDFCLSFRQCSLDLSFYNTFVTTSHQGTFVSTRDSHALNVVSTYFQSTIPPLFDEIKHAISAWIDDVTIYLKTEDAFFETLEKFLII